VDSPVDLHLYDAKGRHVGFNYEKGEVEIEIPGATYSGPDTEPQVITVPKPKGSYRIELVGKEQGVYALTIEGFIESSVMSMRSFEGTISKGECQVAKVSVTGIAGPLTVDVKAPTPVPSGLKADAGDSIVRLSWDPYDVEGFDLAGYNVYRSNQKGTGYQKINTEPVSSPNYEDTGVVNTFTYYYVVTAVSTTGEETEHSREVKAIPLPTTEEIIVEEVLNYPNPCYSGTAFSYVLSHEAHVRIEIYTLAGERIKVIDPASGNVGYNEQYWDGTDDQGYLVDNGVYIYLIIAEADGKVARAIGRLVVLR